MYVTRQNPVKSVYALVEHWPRAPRPKDINRMNVFSADVEALRPELSLYVNTLAYVSYFFFHIILSF